MAFSYLLLSPQTPVGKNGVLTNSGMYKVILSSLGTGESALERLSNFSGGSEVK